MLRNRNRQEQCSNMNLQLPVRKKITNSSFNTRPDAVRVWVDELPLINPEKSRKLLEHALLQINQLSITSSDRYETLELLATSAICVADAMKRVFLAKPIPLRGNNLSLATQTAELYNQMATGYRILVDDTGDDDSQNFYLTQAVHRSLRYLSEVLLTNYQIYLQYPDGLWKTIHSLYALAEQHGITTIPVTDNTLSTPATSTISTVYKQVLLMSLACPYRLRQKEIHFVYNALLDWADITRLYQMGDAETPGLFAVNLNADYPPSYRVLNHNITQVQLWRILDTTSMADRIRDTLDKQPGNGNRHIGIGDTNILQRLMLAWGVMPARRFARHTKSAEVALLVGLNAIHQHVMGPEGRSSGKEQANEEPRYLQDPTFEAATTFRTTRSADDGQGIVTPEIARTQQSRNKHNTVIPRIESWKMANISAGGYSLLWDSDDSSSAQVGELVAIIEQDDLVGGEWQLGVVRWMKGTKAYGLELGIQMLSPNARAVWAYAEDTDLSVGGKVQGMLLPEIKMIQQPTSLLLPTLPFRAGSTTQLESAGSLQNIKLTRQLENTGRFAQYHFSASISD